VHGRTRACMYKGDAEYDTIKAIKQAVSIPVVANGDITDALKAKYVLEYTEADAVMIGRGAQGHPWIFREILHYLQTGQILAAPSIEEVSSVLLEHVANVHQFYGEFMGCRIARKHVGWYLAEKDQQRLFRAKFNVIEDARQQLDELAVYFDKLADEQATTPMGALTSTAV
ncbi:MAG: tRNA-dihydrouridine synthase, partial [Lentilitoribacter sp.]